MVRKINPSIIKWPGGKEKELGYIFNSLPKIFNNYYEPFVGGGSVFLNITANKYFINDKASELVNLYKVLKDANLRGVMLDYLKELDICWISISEFVKDSEQTISDIYQLYKHNLNTKDLGNTLTEFLNKNDKYFQNLFPKPYSQMFEVFDKELNINLKRKMIRMVQLENKRGLLPMEDFTKNIESAIKSAFYMKMRYFLNKIDTLNFNLVEKIVVFYFIRSYTYSGMFRYNNSGEFNVPYGGISYNNNFLKKRISSFKSDLLIERLQKSVIEDLDFYEFLSKHNPQKNDFVFLDPPYDTDFSSYNNSNFNRDDQKRLADYLTTECVAKWLLIIKNTDFVLSLYNKKGLFINSFDKTYQVSFMNRNNKNTEHLIITNYKYESSFVS